MAFSPANLGDWLKAQLPSEWDGALAVAFSGGLDSVVLLHAAARLTAAAPRLRVRAIHIDHGLHPESARWAERCAMTARSLGLEIVTQRVSVGSTAGVGLEAAAREARYEALRSLLHDREALATAHHADDQLETMLLALMRGAGVRGLAAMPACRSFGRGWHVRPLLGCTRAEIEAWARAEGCEWLEDPSNANLALDRNFLRHRVVGALRERWPGAAQSAVRAAAHLAEANDVLDGVAEADHAAAAVGQCLDIAIVAPLAPMRRRNLLRYWLRRGGARPPSARKLAALDHDMLHAQDDRTPCVEWDGFEVRRHRGLLYLALARTPFTDALQSLPWDGRAPLSLPADLGSLRLERREEGGLDLGAIGHQLSVRFRSGGEEIRPTGDAHHRKLKKLLQDADILPWWRDRLPLVYVADRLACVGDLWIAAEFATAAGRPGAALVWDARPRIEATRR